MQWPLVGETHVHVKLKGEKAMQDLATAVPSITKAGQQYGK